MQFVKVSIYPPMKRDIWSKYCERVVYLVNFTSSVSSFLSHPPKHGQSSSSCKPKLMFLEVPWSRWSLKRFLRSARGQMWYLKIHHMSGSLSSPSLKSVHSESFILFSHFSPGICYSYYYLHFLWRMSQHLKALSGVGMEYKGADSGNYAKEKYHIQILDEIHKLFCISVNASYFSPSQKITFTLIHQTTFLMCNYLKRKYS